jgi:alkyl hydroperoxide reductase subunit AhpC
MARDHQEFLRRGSELVGVSVDPPEVNAQLIHKLRLPFPLLSDRDGEAVIKPLEAWHDDPTHGFISRPGIVAIAPDGRIIHYYVGADFMDRRPDEQEVFEELEALGLEPHDPPPLNPAQGHPSEAGARVTPDYLFAYYRGIHFATKALSGRVEDEAARAEIDRTHRQLTRYMEAVAPLRSSR